MTADRLQASWRYANVEIWRPLQERFRIDHPDLPIEIVRTLLVRPTQMAQIFRGHGEDLALDRLRGDTATYLDSPEDARLALRRIRSHFFLGGRAIAIALSDIATALHEYGNANLDQAYRGRVAAFIERHALPYRIESAPLKLLPLLHGDVDALYHALRTRAGADPHLQEALSAFEKVWERQATDWSQISAKEAIRTASLLAENMLVSASRGRDNEFSRALARMRSANRFPSNDFANIFDRAYTFVNSYPNIRHPGNASSAKRDLRREDAVLSALVFVGLSACAHTLWED